MTVARPRRPKALVIAQSGNPSGSAAAPAVLSLSSTVNGRKGSEQSSDRDADEEFCQQILQKLFCDNCALKHRSIDDELRQQMAAYGMRCDIQTGLLNHQSFQEALVALLRDGPPGQEIALIWIDLLNLRREFSLRGCRGSEKLVRHVAGVLRSLVDADDLLARFSGRCFLVSMHAGKWDRKGRLRIQAVADALSHLGDGGPEKPEIAAGVAFYPTDTVSAEALMRFACLAATQAGNLKTPRPAVLTFHDGMNSLIMRQDQLEAEMRKGLDLGQFSVAYQAQVDLATGALLGAETLVRWRHPDLGLVPPSEFIPVAERSGLIHRIFDFTLRSALTDTRNLGRLGLFVPIISVNASAVSLRRDDFARMVRGILSEITIAPAQLELEVTESVLFDDEGLFIKRVRQLKEIGVRISIDDFGTRYTGFNVLLRLPLSAMKIDKCFVGGIDRSLEMRALCQTIVAMSRQLKMHTVAEGIEEFGELETLRRSAARPARVICFSAPSRSGNSPFSCAIGPNGCGHSVLWNPSK